MKAKDVLAEDRDSTMREEIEDVLLLLQHASHYTDRAEDIMKHQITLALGQMDEIIKRREAQLKQDMLDIVGEVIDWKWVRYCDIPSNAKCIKEFGFDPKGYIFSVCNVCYEHEFHPETAHLCEYENEITKQKRKAINEYFEGSE